MGRRGSLFPRLIKLRNEGNSKPVNAARAGLMLACIGDVMPAEVAISETLSVASVKHRIWQPLEGVDAVFMNMEAPITAATGVHRNKRYCFRCAPDILELFDARFLVGLANNHIFDYGEKGLLDTIEALDSRNIVHAGAGHNLRSAGPVEVKIAGVSLGIVCAADTRYHAATGNSAGTFPAIPGLLREAVSEMRRRGALVIVSIHSGQEFIPVPSPQQRHLADLCLEEGARIVSFHHAHCVSGWQQDSRGIILFGTGNYLFPRGDTPSCYSAYQEGAAWRISLFPFQPENERLEIRPILIDNNGLPFIAPAGDAAGILRRIGRYTDRIRAGRFGLWRLWEMAKPVYLWMNAINYADIARRNGISASLKLLMEGMKAQLASGRRERRHE
jgi:hypothetical protein